jgi:hypothetical protein
MHKKATAILGEEIGPCGTHGVKQQKQELLSNGTSLTRKAFFGP